MNNQHKRRIAPPEFWRFVFIMFICFLHYEEDIYNSHHLIANAGYLGVDFFFVLSGFIITYQHKINPITNPLHFTWERIKKVYPDFLFAIILMFSLWIIIDCSSIMDLIHHVCSHFLQFFLVNAFIPSGLEMRSLWFLSYWVIGIFLLALLLVKKCPNYLLGGVTLTFFSWHYQNIGCLYGDSTIPVYIWSIRLIKCVSEILIGSLAYSFYENIAKYKLQRSGQVFFSVIELFVATFIIVVITINGRNLLDYFVLAFFCVIIIFSFYNKTVISNLLNNRTSIFLGKLSMPIYLYHLFTVKIVLTYFPNMGSKIFSYVISMIAILFTSYFFHLFVECYFGKFLALIIKSLIKREDG